MSGKNATPGNCFEDSFHILFENEEIEYILVHGIPTFQKGPNAGKRYMHAWLEFKVFGVPFCLDHLHQDHPILLPVYYDVGKIDYVECKYYSRKEAFTKAIKTRNSGPWHPVPKGVLIGPKPNPRRKKK